MMPPVKLFVVAYSHAYLGTVMQPCDVLTYLFCDKVGAPTSDIQFWTNISLMRVDVVYTSKATHMHIPNTNANDIHNKTKYQYKTVKLESKLYR